MKFGHHREHAPDDHRDDEQIVELMVVSTRFEGDVIVAALAARGITASASLSGNLFGGGSPKGRNNRILVFESDLEVARALVVAEGLDDENGFDPDE